jgi:hypothetical protein
MIYEPLNRRTLEKNQIYQDDYTGQLYFMHEHSTDETRLYLDNCKIEKGDMLSVHYAYDDVTKYGIFLGVERGGFNSSVSVQRTTISILMDGSVEKMWFTNGMNIKKID